MGSAAASSLRRAVVHRLLRLWRNSNDEAQYQPGEYEAKVVPHQERPTKVYILAVTCFRHVLGLRSSKIG